MSSSNPSSKPVPVKAPKAAVWHFAEQVSQRLGLKPGAPLDPLVANLGGQIVFKAPVSTEGRLPESIVVNSAKDFTIFLPTMTSPERDRFTIAHELGHFFLHYPLAAKQHPGLPMIATRWVDENDPDQQRSEWEANWFAAAFLMPAKAFRETAQRAPTAEGLARLFVVSTRAAEIRKKDLSLP